MQALHTPIEPQKPKGLEICTPTKPKKNKIVEPCTPIKPKKIKSVEPHTHMKPRKINFFRPRFGIDYINLHYAKVKFVPKNPNDGDYVLLIDDHRKKDNVFM